ncbi:MAG: GH36-type glycosyl hydrolase domain-containing protein [Haloarculaceae archaeon]
MRYGHVDQETGEYVIEQPDTPTPWINYLGEGIYGGIVSNTGGGYSFYRDPKNQRVTRYRYNAVPEDQPGRYVYLRDADTGEYWSPTWQPVKEDLDEYECRHGPGYTEITAEYDGVASEMLYFVPLGEDCELWSLTLENESDETKTLQAYSYVEFSFPDAMADQTNLDWTGQIMRARVDEDDGVIEMYSSAMEISYTHATSADVAGFDTQRADFVGEYGTLESPAVVESGEATGSVATHDNVIGSFEHEVTLEPGERKRIVFQTAPERDDDLVEKYDDPAVVDEEFAALCEEWDDYLSALQVDTPDDQMNTMLNVWNPIQCRSTLYWSRTASLYQAGLGRGMGTRDSSQDTLSIVHAVPDRVRETLEMLWEIQFEEGHAWHQVYPLSGEGDVGHAAEEPDKPQWFSDDHLWLVLGTVQYLKETGDFDFLEKEIPFSGGEEATVREHIERALAFTDEHRGEHGIPRMGYADWNDTLNPDHGSGRAASVMAGMMYCRVLDEVADLYEFLGEEDEATAYRERREEEVERINEYTWDGDWYVRAYDDDGDPIGTVDDEYQKISLNAQTWSIVGGVAPEDRAESAMESAHEWLNTKYGFATLHPPWEGEGTVERIGGTTTFPPGAKENGGIFCHAHTWSIVAAAMMGWGEDAHTYYRQLLPLAHQDDADRRRVEPYVYNQNILGPEHPDFGVGKNSWLTGTASWAYVSGTQYILGVRPTLDGLEIDPSIPADWDGFEMTREFRGATYEITVDNPENVESGVAQVRVDGEPVDGQVVPAFEDGDTHHVEVVMG